MSDLKCFTRNSALNCHLLLVIANSRVSSAFEKSCSTLVVTITSSAHERSIAADALTVHIGLIIQKEPNGLELQESTNRHLNRNQTIQSENSTHPPSICTPDQCRIAVQIPMRKILELVY
jgi:hypothetical protein